MSEVKVPQLDTIVERYVQLRDRKEQMNKAHEEKLAPLNEAMKRLEGAILGNLQAQGAESFRTKAGTAYLKNTVSITTADKLAFTNWLHETGNWDTADIRPAKVAIEEFRKDNDDIPPGLNWKESVSVGIRRA
jgi:hypothetical protein